MIEKLRKRKENYTTRLKRFRIVVPYSHLSFLFDINTNSITKIIIKIRKYLKDNYDEKLK